MPTKISNDRHVPAGLIDVGKIGKEYARNAQRSTDAPQSLTAHVPSPFGKARFMNPCRFLKGCDALAAPSPSPPDTRESAQRGRKGSCPNITCMRRRAVPRPGREWDKGHAHLRPNTMTKRPTQPSREGKGRCDDRNRHTSPQNQPASIVRPSLCSRSHSADSDRKIKKKRERAEGRSSITRPNPTRNPNQIIIVNGRHSAWK